MGRFSGGERTSGGSKGPSDSQMRYRAENERYAIEWAEMNSKIYNNDRSKGWSLSTSFGKNGSTRDIFWLCFRPPKDAYGCQSSYPISLYLEPIEFRQSLERHHRAMMKLSRDTLEAWDLKNGNFM